MQFLVEYIFLALSLAASDLPKSRLYT